jgi:hypothetical protein
VWGAGLRPWCLAWLPTRLFGMLEGSVCDDVGVGAADKKGVMRGN